ncbi:MAG: hypothetical protein KAR54_03630, partial [Candidatus Pacebacteria bacterium]|nr:hypothetical protein [Candidatus Paceibacterota bacterium]
EETIIKVAFADFENSAANFINKKIEISAIVNHVCKHGGQKLFLVEGETEESIKVISGENLAAFNTDLEGNSIKVIGVVEELRIDETYLREWEAEIAAEIKHAEEESDDHGHSEKGKEADLGEHVSSKESIANFRKEIAESGTDHLSFYSIICEKYEVITPDGN